MNQVPINTDKDGNASAIVAGCFKFGGATILRGGCGTYGTTGTAIMVEYESKTTDKKRIHRGVR